MRAQKLIISLGLIALGIVSSQGSGFSQETNQAVAARKIIMKVEPQYPELARRYRLFGKVRIEAVVSPDGSIKKAHEIGGGPVLVRAALDAVQQWKFEAGRKETTEIIEIVFNRENTGS